MRPPTTLPRSRSPHNAVNSPSYYNKPLFVFVSHSAGSDYISVDTFFTFTAGLENEEISIDILIVNDTTLENLEQFFANLVLSTTPLNVTVEPSRATISIVDEDGKALLCVSRVSGYY